MFREPESEGTLLGGDEGSADWKRPLEGMRWLRNMKSESTNHAESERGSRLRAYVQPTFLPGTHVRYAFPIPLRFWHGLFDTKHKYILCPADDDRQIYRGHDERGDLACDRDNLVSERRLVRMLVHAGRRNEQWKTRGVRAAHCQSLLRTLHQSTSASPAAVFPGAFSSAKRAATSGPASAPIRGLSSTRRRPRTALKSQHLASCLPSSQVR